MTEFLEDLWEKDKDKFNEFCIDGEEDDAVLTGDPVIDELERRLARGEDITVEVLDELLGPDPEPTTSSALGSKLPDWAKPGVVKEDVDAEGFSDDYTDPEPH